jgi:hypothetical protein
MISERDSSEISSAQLIAGQLNEMEKLFYDFYSD